MTFKKRLLVICGPTSTGKTDLGIYLCKKFSGEIISADSRQVYKGMDIGTGKKYSNEVTIWGYDLVSPNEDFSVAHFQSFANQKVLEIINRGRLPILVGGTGLYINSVITGIGTSHIPQNLKLRKDLESKTVIELFKILKTLDPKKASLLNASDSKNPRRLIRAIEVVSSKEKEKNKVIELDVLKVGLSSSLERLYERVDNSITERLNRGFEKEVIKLLKVFKPDIKSLTATGYREFVEYLNGNISREEAIKRWRLSEKQYVKRQLTWFKKDLSVSWFDVLSITYKSDVENLVKTWENKHEHAS